MKSPWVKKSSVIVKVRQLCGSNRNPAVEVILEILGHFDTDSSF